MTGLADLGDDAFELSSDLDAPDDLDLFVHDATRRHPSFAEGLADIETRTSVLRRLVSRRHECGLTQTSVGTAMGTTQSAVSELEAGGTDLYLSTLQRYARAVGAHLTLGVTLRQDGRRITTPLNAHVYSLNWRTAHESRVRSDERGQECA